MTVGDAPLLTVRAIVFGAQFSVVWPSRTIRLKGLSFRDLLSGALLPLSHPAPWPIDLLTGLADLGHRRQPLGVRRQAAYRIANTLDDVGFVAAQDRYNRADINLGIIGVARPIAAEENFRPTARVGFQVFSRLQIAQCICQLLP